MVAETSKVQYVVYKVSYKKDIVVSAPAIKVAKVISVIADLGTDTTIFAAKVAGDTVIVQLLDANGTVIATTDAVLVVLNN